MIAVARAIMAPSPRIARCRELRGLVLVLSRTGRAPGARFNVGLAQATAFSYAQGNAAVDPEPDLFRLRTMLGSAGAGSLRNKLGVVWRLRSLWAKMSLLAVIFALVPLFLYFEFSKAHQDSQDLLLQSVRGQGRVMSQSLLPLLENADGNTLLGLGQARGPRPVDAELPRRTAVLADVRPADRRFRDRHRGHAAVDGSGMLGGGRFLLRRCLSRGPSRPALLGDANRAVRRGHLPGDGRHHLLDPVGHRRRVAPLRPSGAGDPRTAPPHRQLRGAQRNPGACRRRRRVRPYGRRAQSLGRGDPPSSRGQRARLQ